LRLKVLDTHKYLRDLEELVILVLSDYGIEAGRHPEYTGVGSTKTRSPPSA
jgi:lipoyl(octanoyl) transferase